LTKTSFVFSNSTDRSYNAGVTSTLIECAGAALTHGTERQFVVHHVEGFGPGMKGPIPVSAETLDLEGVKKYLQETSIIIWLDIEELGAGEIHYQIADGYVWHVNWEFGIDEQKLQKLIEEIGGRRDDKYNGMIV